MPPVNSQTLLENLQSDVRELLLQATHLLREDPEFLMMAPAAGSWSAAQAIEHLNSYSAWYLPRIAARLESAPDEPGITFKAGWLGGLFTRMMLPGENGQVRFKMKSPKPHRPLASVHSQPVLAQFIQDQQQLLQLLTLASRKSLSERMAISLSSMVRLQTGDIFGFIIAHEQRHMAQAIRALEAAKAGGLSGKNIQEAVG